jgi:Tfp pilus assembly protein PilV
MTTKNQKNNNHSQFRASFQRKDGFTLMEFLIYIGILVFLMTALSLIAVNVLNMRAKINAVDRVSRNTEMAMNIITGNIQNAKSVNSAGASLSLEIYQGYNDPTVFSLSDGKIMMSRGGRDAVPITSDKVEVTSLSFSNPSSRMVEIEFTIENVNPQSFFSYDFEKTFSTKENVRHSE